MNVKSVAPPIPNSPNVPFPDTLTPFRYFCQRVLPAVYGDELSYYELLCKVIEYLNTTMENVNILNEDMKKIYDFVNQLRDYVENYFENLDVQEEINKKLDEMLADGTLTDAISNLVNQMTGYARNDIGMTKIGTVSLPENHTVCCASNDGTYVYIVHHINDAGYIYVDKLTYPQLEPIASIQTMTNYHGNSCDIVGKYLVICGFSTFIYVDLETFKFAGTYTMPSTSANYTRIACSHNASSLCLGTTYTTTMTYFGLTANNCYEAYNRVTAEPIGNMLRQDMCGTDTFVYSLESKTGTYSMNTIRVLTWNGDLFKLLILPSMFRELEGIARPKGANYIMLVDVQGDVYQFDTSNGIISSSGVRYREAMSKATGTLYGELGRSKPLPITGDYKIEVRRKTYLPNPIGASPISIVTDAGIGRANIMRLYTPVTFTTTGQNIYFRGVLFAEQNIFINGYIIWTYDSTDYSMTITGVSMYGYNATNGKTANASRTFQDEADCISWFSNQYQTFLTNIDMPTSLNMYLYLQGTGVAPSFINTTEFSTVPVDNIPSGA